MYSNYVHKKDVLQKKWDWIPLFIADYFPSYYVNRVALLKIWNKLNAHWYFDGWKELCKMRNREKHVREWMNKIQQADLNVFAQNYNTILLSEYFQRG